ncbi:MAG TPA: type II toxin-antitoxin system Phd/YefM family antitoxin [Anaerolineae bacterium]|nr:type II toxin-antitoxin system Phd/YefM family antitoxin [Anaerolineae bacterium]
MKQHIWQLQEAKNRFSQVVEQALRQGPQVITRHGIEAVIVLSYQEYRRLLLRQSKLSDFFRRSPLAGVALDLHRDQSSWRRNVEL